MVSHASITGPLVDFQQMSVELNGNHYAKKPNNYYDARALRQVNSKI